MNYFVTASNLNLRSTPIVNNENIITVLKNYAIVNVLDRSNPVFYKVSYTDNNQHVLSGYVSPRFLRPEEDIDEKLIGFLEPVHLNSTSKSTRQSKSERQCALSEGNMPHINVDATSLDRISAMHEIINYLDVENSLRYQPDKYTYCNIYAYDYCFLAGVFIPRVWWLDKSIRALETGDRLKPIYGVTVSEKTANELFTWLELWGKEYKWVRTYDLDELQNKVNEGRVGIICAATINSNYHGHICCVIPEKEDQIALRFSGKVLCPLLSQAGRHNIKLYNDKKWWVTEKENFRGFGYWYC